MLLTKMPTDTPACSPAPCRTRPWCWGSATLRKSAGTSPPAAAGSLSAQRPASTAGTSISSQAASSGRGRSAIGSPVAVREVGAQRSAARPGAVDERPRAQHERLHPARDGVVAEAAAGVGEVGRGLAIARSEPQHIRGREAPRAARARAEVRLASSSQAGPRAAANASGCMLEGVAGPARARRPWSEPGATS